MLRKEEQQLYDKLTRKCNFRPLPIQILQMVEDCNLSGEAHPEFRYICYHFHSYSYTKRQYEALCEFHEELLPKVQEFKQLYDNISNTLIVLREPLAYSGQKEYEGKNIAYWREIVNTTPEIQLRSEFIKYLK